MSARRVAVVLQQNPRIPLGNLEPLLRERDYEIRLIETPSGRVPDLDPVEGDVAIVLGGHEAAYELEKFPYLVGVREFLKRRVDAERPTIGICLGAQLMAGALGGENYRGERPDISYRTIELTEAGLASELSLARGIPMLQWHGDHFTLPDGATVLGYSTAYPNEAFAIGDFALGLQFHPEVTDEVHEWWIEDTGELLEREGIDVDWWREQRAEYNPPMQAASRAVFDAWLSAAERRSL